MWWNIWNHNCKKKNNSFQELSLVIISLSITFSALTAIRLGKGLEHWETSLSLATMVSQHTIAPEWPFKHPVRRVLASFGLNTDGSNGWKENKTNKITLNKENIGQINDNVLFWDEYEVLYLPNNSFHRHHGLR